MKANLSNAKRLHAWASEHTKVRDVGALGPSELLLAGRALDLSIREVMAARETLVDRTVVPSVVRRYQQISAGLTTLDQI